MAQTCSPSLARSLRSDPPSSGEAVITRVDPLSTLAGPGAETMNFLNEVIGRYPHALSFAAGRPPNAFVPTADAPRWLEHYIAHVADVSGRSLADARVFVGQYSDTGGIIQPLIARFLAAEGEGPISPHQIMVANGFQEALLVHLTRLARRGGAVVALDPTYVGLTGGAMAAGLPLYAATRGDDAIEALARAVHRARADGHAEVAVYVIPDFDNPSGVSLTLSQRHALLDLARDHGVLVLEDVAYRFFNYDGARIPSLLALDRQGCVVHLGTFSKMFLPGVRIGFAAVQSTETSLMSDALAIKSFTTVATAPIAQAIVGGFLLEQDFKVAAWNGPRRDYCAGNRDALDRAFTAQFADLPDVSWSTPTGGFFSTVTLPFPIEGRDIDRLAATYGVIATPMVFFSPSGGFTHQVRFAFSNSDPASISMGIERFAAYVHARLSGRE